MPRFSLLFAPALAVFTVSATAAMSQTSDMTGIWRCEQGAAPLRDKNLPTIYVVFDIELYRDGTMRAAGVANQINQFQAQGRWGMQGNRFTTQGQMVDALGPSQFGFSSLVTSGTTMNERFSDQTNSHATACQKGP